MVTIRKSVQQRARTARSLKLYPADMPDYPFEPTRRDFAVVRVGDHEGEGLQARRDFDAGEIVFVFTGWVLNQITQYTLQFEPGTHIHDPYVMGKVLHSCDPNMSCDMTTRTFRAARPIRAGELVTMDYETTEDVLFRPFECSCGAANCRGQISGRLVS